MKEALRSKGEGQNPPELTWVKWSSPFQAPTVVDLGHKLMPESKNLSYMNVRTREPGHNLNSGPCTLLKTEYEKWLVGLYEQLYTSSSK